MPLGLWSPPEHLAAKPKIRVLILGSYEGEAFDKLERLRNYLIGKGYHQTCIVYDFEEPEQNDSETAEAFALRKSEYWISRADDPVWGFQPWNARGPIRSS